MRLFAVRFIESHEAVGFYFLDSADDITAAIDETADPGECEYQEIEGVAAIAWHRSRAKMGHDLDEEQINSAVDELHRSMSFDWAFQDFLFEDQAEGWTPVHGEDAAKNCVYFIRSENHIKIGFTSGPVTKRIAALTTGSPTKLELLATVSGTFALEKRLHGRFAALRERGEWFRADPELLAFIAEIKAGGSPL